MTWHERRVVFYKSPLKSDDFVAFRDTIDGNLNREGPVRLKRHRVLLRGFKTVLS